MMSYNYCLQRIADIDCALEIQRLLIQDETNLTYVRKWKAGIDVNLDLRMAYMLLRDLTEPPQPTI